MVPMPEEAADAVSLENMLVYKSPPIDLVKFQNDYSLQLERQVHQAVFNSNAFVSKNLAVGSDGAPEVEITATGEDYNMESVYDTLKPYTLHYSETWVDIVTTFARLAGATREDVQIAHRFPQDLKMKNTRVLLADLKNANDSGAPSFMIDLINDDLAEVVYIGDPDSLKKYRTTKRYYPFSGKTPEQITELMNSKWVPDTIKVLYANFETIFKEIITDEPLFFAIADVKKQDQIVKDKVAEWLEKITPMAGALPPFTLPPGDTAASEDEEEQEEEETTE